MTGIDVQRVKISAQHALPIGGQMQNHNERHAAIGRHVVEKTVESIDATGRCADSDDRELTGTHLGSRHVVVEAVIGAGTI